MKIFEIINEDVSAEEQLGGGDHNLSANLMPVLQFLKNRSEDKELAPKLRTDSLIQLVKNAGDTTFNYQALVTAHENDDAVKEMIKSFNEDEIILKSDFDRSGSSSDSGGETHGDDSSDEEGGQHGGPEDPTVTVDKMAKRAAGKRG
jgi:hypothetical protein